MERELKAKADNVKTFAYDTMLQKEMVQKMLDCMWFNGYKTEQELFQLDNKKTYMAVKFN